MESIRVGVIATSLDLRTHIEREVTERGEKLKSVEFVYLDAEVLKKDEGLDDRISRSAENFDVILAEPSLISSSFKKNSFSNAGKLKWLQSTWAGVNAFLPSNVPHFKFSRLGDAFGPLIASYCLGYIINLERDLLTYREDQKEAKWQQRTYRSLEELKVGILGYGNIGKVIAQRCASFGMEIYTIKRSTNPDSSVTTVDSLEQLLSTVDYLINVLPMTKQTDDLLSNGVLSHCKRGCTFINVGRGNVIKEESLLEALQKEWISNAVLDVFNVEPLPKESPLWKLPNVYITPHISGVSLARDIAKIFMDNLERFVDGGEPQFQVNWEKGY